MSIQDKLIPLGGVFHSGVLYLHTDPSLWEEFYSLHSQEFEELIARFSQTRNEEDFIWLKPHGDHFFLLGILWDEVELEGAGMLCLIPDRLDDINEVYWTFLKNDFSQGSSKTKAVHQIFAFLKDPEGLALPEDFPFFVHNDFSREYYKNLVIKLPPKDDRLMRIPFDALGECKLGSFAKYITTRYIISDKSILVLLEEQRELDRFLRNDVVFLSKTVIMVNNYRHFYEEENSVADLLRRCVDYMEELAGCFNEVDFNGKKVHLRFCFDSSAGQLLAELRREDTWFVMGDFHTIGYEWVLEQPDGEGFFEAVLRLCMKHIKLMRVFHCYSGKAEKGQESIAASLIGRGVNSVEGSAGKEKFKSFLYAVIYTLIYDREAYVIQYEWMRGVSLLDRGKELLAELEQSGVQLRQSNLRI